MENSQVLATSLSKKGYQLVSGGTDNHLCLADLRPEGVNGAKVERVLEMANVALNKNTVPGDLSALNPGGIRIGSPAMTSRGCDGKDFEQIANFIYRGVEISKNIQSKAGSKTMKAFRTTLEEGNSDIETLKAEVTEFATQFPPVGV